MLIARLAGNINNYAIGVAQASENQSLILRKTIFALGHENRCALYYTCHYSAGRAWNNILKYWKYIMSLLCFILLRLAPERDVIILVMFKVEKIAYTPTDKTYWETISDGTFPICDHITLCTLRRHGCNKILAEFIIKLQKCQ